MYDVNTWMTWLFAVGFTNNKYTILYKYIYV